MLLEGSRNNTRQHIQVLFLSIRVAGTYRLTCLIPPPKGKTCSSERSEKPEVKRPSVIMPIFCDLKMENCIFMRKMTGMIVVIWGRPISKQNLNLISFKYMIADSPGDSLLGGPYRKPELILARNSCPNFFRSYSKAFLEPKSSGSTGKQTNQILLLGFLQKISVLFFRFAKLPAPGLLVQAIVECSAPWI